MQENLIFTFKELSHLDKYIKKDMMIMVFVQKYLEVLGGKNCFILSNYKKAL